jgi:hypothetical protein
MIGAIYKIIPCNGAGFAGRQNFDRLASRWRKPVRLTLALVIITSPHCRRAACTPVVIVIHYVSSFANSFGEHIVLT